MWNFYSSPLDVEHCEIASMSVAIQNCQIVSSNSWLDY